MKEKTIERTVRAAAFGILTLLLPVLIFFSQKLPILYKIALPVLIATAYIPLSIKLLNLTEFKIGKWGWTTIIAITALAILFLMPAYYNIKFVNTKGQPIEGIVVVTGDIEKTYTGWFLLPRGRYMITYTGEYRERKSAKVNNYFNPLPVIKTITLKPGTYNYDKTTFHEPYEKIELQPEITAKGETIDGDRFETTTDKTGWIPYGTYRTTFKTELFSKVQDLGPDTPPQKIILNPNENTIVLSEEEAEWVRNYLKEYVELSASKIIAQGGWPKQMHLFSKNATLSLGDMLFVLCQLSQEKQPTIYAPREKQYVKQGAEECYTSMLQGKVPERVQGMKAEQAAYELISDTVRAAPFEFGELNQKRKMMEWALSYDIEYGRYVPKEGVTDATYTTCKAAMGYLTPEQCSDADYAGWVSETDGIWWWGEYEYPVSSGMIGWRWILELSDRYGIPTTQYMVSKDIDLFKKKDPVLFEESKELVKEGLIEIGSHTRYHTRLDKVSIETAKTEMIESKNDLEEMYSVEITGFRNPYLALAGGTIADNEKALAETSYSQYSLYGEPRKTEIGEKIIEHKPINFFGYLGYAPLTYLDAAEGLPYIISLDHPWNIMFNEKITERGIVLQEAPHQPIQNLAFILEAMSRGVWFTTVEKIEVK